MAYTEALRTISLQADRSLATYTGVPGLPGSADPNWGFQFRFVKVTGDRTAGLADTTEGEIVIGVMQNKPQYTGQAATIAFQGVTYVQCGGTVAPGDGVTTDASGRAVVGTPVLGIATTGAAVGEIASVLIKTV